MMQFIFCFTRFPTSSADHHHLVYKETLSKLGHLTFFVLFSFLGLLEIRHMVYISILPLNGCFISKYGPGEFLCKLQGMLHIHVLECFARA